MVGNLKAAARDGEVQYTFVVGVLCIGLLLSGVTGSLYPTLGKSVRVAVFEVTSALTTTGFSTVFYTGWNSLGIGVLILLMLVGGGTYSTAGGLKQYRAYVLMKALLWEIRRSLLPSKVVEENCIWSGGRKSYIRDEHIRRIAVFTFLYFISFAVGTGIIAAYGYSLSDAAFEYASSQGTVGLSVGVTRADAPGGVLWVEILGMFLGRLEFLVVLTGVLRVGRDFLRLVR
jgi:trk system potassium uptake protein TrkH